MGIDGLRSRHQAMARSVAYCVLLVVNQAVAVPGRITQETLPGHELRYTLSLPAARSATAPVPLVVSLHYGGPVSPWYGRGLLEQVVEPALRPLGAVMVAPDCPERAWMDCRAVVEQVVAHVQALHATAPDCMIITGYSKGGIGTWALVSDAPSRFAAAVVMAARAPGRDILSAWKTPVRVIHGASDELFPVAPVTAAVEALTAAGVDADLEVLDGVTHYDTHRFQAPLAGLVDWLRDRCGHR